MTKTDELSSGELSREELLREVRSELIALQVDMSISAGEQLAYEYCAKLLGALAAEGCFSRAADAFRMVKQQIEKMAEGAKQRQAAARTALEKLPR